MATSISTLGQALDQISRLKTQQKTMDLLTTQLNTGKKSQNFSGLQQDGIFSQRARANIKSLDTYLSNIKHANRRINLMTSSMNQMKTQAQSVLSSLQLSLQEGDYENFEVLQQQAGAAYDFMIDLMNTQDGDRYLFSGSDSDTQPITETGFLETFFGEFIPDETDLTDPPLTASGIIGQWGEETITTAQFISAYRATTEATMGYSSTLTSDTAGKVTTRVSDKSEIDYTVLANAEGMKEVLLALSVIKSLPPPEHAPGALNDPDATTFDEDTPPFPPSQKQENFYAVLDDLTAMLSNAVKKIDSENYRLAQVQTQIQSVKNSHTQELNTLQTIVSDVENVDITETAAKITQLQVQIEASYQVTALVSRLSLVNFI